MKKVNIFQYQLQCQKQKQVFLEKRQWINGLKVVKV